MNCPRCEGLMVRDWCMDREGDLQSIWVQEWRCLNCGELSDSVTRENRLRSNLIPSVTRRTSRQTRKEKTVLSA